MYTVRICLMVSFVIIINIKIAPAASEGGTQKWDPSSDKSRDLAEQLLELMQKKSQGAPKKFLDHVIAAAYNQEKKQYFVTMKVCLRRIDKSEDGCNEDGCENSKEKENSGCDDEECEKSEENESGCDDEKCEDSKENESGCDNGCFENSEDDDAGCSDSTSCVFGSSKGLGGLSSAFIRRPKRSGDGECCERCSVCACCSNCDGKNTLKIKTFKCEPCN